MKRSEIISAVMKDSDGKHSENTVKELLLLLECYGMSPPLYQGQRVWEDGDAYGFDGETVTITSPDHCSICNSPPTWDDVARMFLTASTRLTELELYVSDEECLSETNDLVKKAFVSYFKKVHPDVLEEFLKTALEKIK